MTMMIQVRLMAQILVEDAASVAEKETQRQDDVLRWWEA